MLATFASPARAALGVVLGLIGGVALPGALRWRQSVEDFYKGKTISMVIGYPRGGDTYARLVARYMGDHIPGKPQIVPRNMPGGSARRRPTSTT